MAGDPDAVAPAALVEAAGPMGEGEDAPNVDAGTVIPAAVDSSDLTVYAGPSVDSPRLMC